MSLATWLFRRRRLLPVPPGAPTPFSWVLDDGASDFSGPSLSLGNRRLLVYPEDSGSLLITAPFGGGTLWFWTPAGQPGKSEWPVGAYDTQIAILLANANVNVTFVGLYRYDSQGNPIELYAAGGTTVSCGTTGPKRWQGITVAPAIQPAAGDRLRLGFTFESIAKGSQDVTIGFGVPDRDYLKVPILMGNPQIVWNGNTLAFPGPLTAYQADLDPDREIDFSAGRVAASILHSLGDKLRVELGNFADAQFEADLDAWWSWASQGKQYAFALDSADVVDLTLSGAAAAGQKDIPLANTSSVVVGARYRLREAAGPEEEIVTIASVTVNVKATAVSNLKFGYVTGDIFRSRDYFPKMVSVDSKKPWMEHLTTWTLDHQMAEDRG